MLLIKNGHIKPIVGQELPRGCVLIGDDGKILSVAAEIAVPDGAQIIDAQGRLVTPGCVEGHCHIGLGPEFMGNVLISDYNEASDPITPHMRAIDGFNPMDASVTNALMGGVTTACTGPGSGNIIGGTFAAVKLAGTRVDDMILKAPVAMKCAFGENPKNAYGQKSNKAPKTRMAIAAMFREFLYKAKSYRDAKEAGQAPAFDIKLEAMLPVMNREIPLKIHAHRADDIFTAIRIAKEFDLRFVLDHCTDGGEITQALAREGVCALVGPSFGKRGKEELRHKSFTTPGKLHAAGIPIGIITDANVTPIQYLPLFAGIAASEGLPMEEAWKAITINPAQIMGIADRVGSLEPGKDGDVVIWTADPLTTVGGRAYITIVDGNVVYQR